MYRRPIVPPEFTVPGGFATAEFVARMLTVHDAVKDYDAVMTSVDRLVGVLDDTGWPLGCTLEENLIDCAWHQREFTIRHSFAYSVLSLDEIRVLGCCYINPGPQGGAKVEAYYWVRTSEAAGGLDDRLGVAFRQFLETRWPFRSIAFPGRDQA